MNRLTEVQVRKAKPRKGSYKISDGGWMYLLVYHNGLKYWLLNYRIDGQQRTQALGVWPAVGLKEAREKRDQILGAGHDLARLYPEDQGFTLIADSDLKSAISHYLKLKDEEKQIHEKKKDLEVLIKQEVKQYAQVLDNKGRQLLLAGNTKTIHASIALPLNKAMMPPSSAVFQYHHQEGAAGGVRVVC